MPETGRRAETLLAFDAGRHRIGVAVGERMLGTGRALEVLRARQGQPDWQRVAGLIQHWKPDALVIGVPRHADGTDSDSTALARKLAGRLHGRFGLPVYEVDERLSSHEAAERRHSRGGTDSDAPLDDEAAAVILETWFRAEAEAGAFVSDSQERV